MFLKPFILRIKDQLRNALPAVQTLIEPYSVFFKSNLRSKIRSKGTWAKIDIQVREALTKERVCLTEVTVTVNDSLRILVLVLHVFPFQFFRHIVIFALANLIQVTTLYRSSIGILLYLWSSRNYAHKRSSCVLMRPVIAEFFFGSFHVYLVAFAWLRKLNFA